MINWKQVNTLQDEKLRLEVTLNELVHDPTITKDKINELKAEILYLNKKLSRCLGTNEIQSMQELKRKRAGIDQRNIKQFYNLRDKYRKLQRIEKATIRMLSVIDSWQETTIYEEEKEKVKK